MPLLGWLFGACCDLGPVLARLDEIDSSLRAIAERMYQMANDLTQLQAKVAELEGKAQEVVATLLGLAQAVIDLLDALGLPVVVARNAVDQQAAIDALTARAQSILDALTTAEDVADDQLPPAP